MSRINMSFFDAYLELDRVCRDRLDVKRGGVSAYINKLVELRFAPDRSEVLPRLLRYRKLRNIIAHEEHAFSELDGIEKADIKWITRFAKSVQKKKDPVSRYERNARNFAFFKRLKIILISLASIALITLLILIIAELSAA